MCGRHEAYPFTLRPPYILVMLEKENLQHSDMHFSKLSYGHFCLSRSPHTRIPSCSWLSSECLLLFHRPFTVIKSENRESQHCNLERNGSKPNQTWENRILGWRYLASSGCHGPWLENRILGRRFPVHHCHQSNPSHTHLSSCIGGVNACTLATTKSRSWIGTSRSCLMFCKSILPKQFKISR